MSILVDVSLRCSAGESSKQCEVNRLSKSCASELFISLRMPLSMLGAADGGVAAKSSGRIGNILSSIKWISDANWLYLVPMRNAALWGTAKNTCTDMGTASRLFGFLLLLFLSDTAARKSIETLVSIPPLLPAASCKECSACQYPSLTDTSLLYAFRVST